MKDETDPPHIPHKVLGGKNEQQTNMKLESTVKISASTKPDESRNLINVINDYRTKDVTQPAFLNLLRRILIKLRPAEEALIYLTYLCESSVLRSRHNHEFETMASVELSRYFSSSSTSNVSARRKRGTYPPDDEYKLTRYQSPLLSTKEEEEKLLGPKNYYEDSSPINCKLSDLDKHYLDELTTISNGISGSPTPQNLLKLQERINFIADEVSLKLENLSNLYHSAVRPAISKKVLIQNMVSHIGHKELNAEAKCHLNNINHLVNDLGENWSETLYLDILCAKTQAVIGTMTEIERHRIYIEKLLILDRKRQHQTLIYVSLYLLFVISLCIAIPIILSINTEWEPPVLIELNKTLIPIIGIPWPVIVWSFIGSFAATIHRFNSKPVYEFKDAVKWMLTRHIQGVVLSSAFYLVIVSGLFILTSGQQSKGQLENEVILVLCFLIGFSDRFVNSVFNALVNKYSMSVESMRSSEEGVYKEKD